MPSTPSAINDVSVSWTRPRLLEVTIAICATVDRHGHDIPTAQALATGRATEGPIRPPAILTIYDVDVASILRRNLDRLYLGPSARFAALIVDLLDRTMPVVDTCAISASVPIAPLAKYAVRRDTSVASRVVFTAVKLLVVALAARA